MVLIAQEDKEFLYFSWKGMTYQFNGLHSSLSYVLAALIKTTHPVIVILRNWASDQSSTEMTL